MIERTLRLGKDFDGAGTEPRFAGWISSLLSFETKIHSTGQQVWIKLRSLAFKYGDFIVQLSKLFSLLFLQSCDFIGRHESRETRRTLLFFSARKCPLRTFHNAIECIVVSGGDWIVFVVVASGTAQRKSQQRSTDRVNRIPKIKVLIVRSVFVPIAFADRQKSCCSHPIGIFFGRTVESKNITSNLFANEFVKGLILVKCVDHPIAILPCFTHRIVGAIARSVCISSDVEPMAPPTFSIGGGLKQTINQCPESVG